MGTPLTGITVASGYPGYLKTGDNLALTTSKLLSDGLGNDAALTLGAAGGASTFSGTLTSTGNFAVGASTFTVAAANGNTVVGGTLSSAGNFAVATTRFTVAAASGNTAVAGTLNVTGACVFTATGSFGGNLSTSQTLTCRAFVQNDVAGSNSLSGAFTVGGLATFNGSAQFNSSVSFAQTATFNGGISSPTITATSTSALGSASAGSLTTTGAVTCGGNLSVNGNTTIGDAAADSLTLNAATWTTPNLPSKAVPVSADTVLIRDSADSNRVKTSTVGSISIIKEFASYENSFRDSFNATQWADRFVQSASGVDWSVTHTFKTIGNTAYIEADINIAAQMAVLLLGAIVETGTGNSVGVSVCPIVGAKNGANMRIRGKFVSTAASHTFKIRLTFNNGGSNVSINGTFSDLDYGTDPTPPTWYVPTSSVVITEV